LEKESMSIRYPKDTSYKFDEDIAPEILEIGSWEKLESGEKVAILATGSMVGVANSNYSSISESLGFNPMLVNSRFIKPMDLNMLNEIENEFDLIITMEEGALNGGFGSAVVEYYSDKNFKSKIVRMGIPDEFVEHATRQELLNDLGLSKDGLIQKIKENLNNE